MRITQSGKITSITIGDEYRLRAEGVVVGSRRNGDLTGHTSLVDAHTEQIHGRFSIEIPDTDTARKAFVVGAEIHVTFGHPPWPKVGVVTDDKADPER
jgi:hypothetical protein